MKSFIFVIFLFSFFLFLQPIDAVELETRLHFNDEGVVDCIERFTPEGGLFSVERFLWKKGFLKKHWVEDDRGEIVVSHLLNYNDQGLLLSESCSGIFFQKGIGSYSVEYCYSDEGERPILEKRIMPGGDQEIISFDYRGDVQKKVKLSREGRVLEVTEFDGRKLDDGSGRTLFSDSSSEELLSDDEIGPLILSAFCKKVEDLSYIEEIRRSVLGKGQFFQLLFGRQEVEVNVIGEKEFDRNIRVTYTNGMNCSLESCKKAVKRISHYHGDVKIHYVFHPTNGFISDAFQSCCIRFGVKSATSLALAVEWKRLLKKMSQTKGVGKIIHYAHSLGGLNTYEAKDFLTKKERQQIEVRTLASPVLIGEDIFGGAINYISVRDGVPNFDPASFFSSDPFQVLHYFGFSFRKNVVFLGKWKEGLPFIEHHLSSRSYRDLLEKLGKKFVERYGE